MYTWYYRLNALATWASTVLVVLLFLNFFTAQWDVVEPMVEVTVNSAEYYRQKMPDYPYQRRNEFSTYDIVPIYLDIKGDLRPLFNWSVRHIYFYVAATYKTPTNRYNSVTLYDQIIEKVDDANLDLEKVMDYYLKESLGQLGGAEVQLSVKWEVHPYAGLLTDYSLPSINLTVPEQYSV